MNYICIDRESIIFYRDLCVNFFPCFLLLVFSNFLFAQNNSDIAGAADNLYEKNYHEAARLYLKAAEVNASEKGFYFYNAACCFALTGNMDSAFFYLEYIIENKSIKWPEIEKDENLIELKKDSRWLKLIELQKNA